MDKPFGELRYSWTNAPVTSPSYALSKYTFTGQYSYMDDPSTAGVSEGFGLMYYNARMYDPALGRFTSADSIVPAGVQGYDRYAYGLNNPSRYTDPTGHESVCGQANSDPECGNLGHSPLSHPKPPKPEQEKEDCKGLECIHNNDIPEDDGITMPIGIPADPPNPSLYALVPLAVIFSVTTAFVEVAIVIAEGAMAPIDAATPIVGIPLSLTLAAAGAAALDLDIAFVVYTARVAEHPEVHQKFEISPLKLWGLRE